ncbi:MAG: SDR family oxidoreductase [Deltaproteobacteria bacterium]|nr:SDR family oxidoreductase [Deltaproteobacteria bacterium]
MNLKNKTVLITGGAVRLGKLLVEAFVERGAHVALHYNSSEQKAFELTRKLGLPGPFQADLSSLSQIDKLVQDVRLRFSTIDILINNAALFFQRNFFETIEDDYDTLMDVNLKSVFFLSQRVAQNMKEAGCGCIVHIGDAGGDILWANYMAYCLSKAGVISLTKAMAKALAPNIRVNCVSSGPLDFAEVDNKNLSNTTLLKKLGRPQDVVSSVLHVVQSEFMTGSVIYVDGGRAII